MMNPVSPPLTINPIYQPLDIKFDKKLLGLTGPSRYVRLPRVTAAGGGAISKSEDGYRCVVAGKESLRILRISSSSQNQKGDHKSAVGEGGCRIDASRNFWDGSGLKIDSVSTDVAWGYGVFNNKILTSARNGELIMWDFNKSGNTKYERRSKDHLRSINKLSVSHLVHHYCITGSADGHLRVWDLRDMSKSIMRVHHPTSVRSLVFSPTAWQPLQAVVGLDNGSIYRWDLKMGQRGQLDRLHVAHTASVTALDWCPVGGISLSTDPTTASTREESSNGPGWIVSGGLDRTVKVWDLTAPESNAHIPHKPTYVLHPSFPVRRLAWRPGHQCELAIVSNVEYSTPSTDPLQLSSTVGSTASLTRVGSAVALDAFIRGSTSLEIVKEKLSSLITADTTVGDVIEIWDVRRRWIAKWSVCGTGGEYGVTDIAFNGPDTIWTQHTSGAFTQFDLREVTKPLDAIPRTAISWEAAGSMAFIADKKEPLEIPFDDAPEIITDAEDKKRARKALGDAPAQTTTQVAATYANHLLTGDTDVFMALARGYICEGRERQEICNHNSEVALAVGNERAAQMWLLLGASIVDYIPNDSQQLPLEDSNKGANIEDQNLTGYAFPPTSKSRTTTNESPSFQWSSPCRASVGRSLSRMASRSVSRRLTPVSSTSSSPRHPPISLPPLSPRRTSFFSHRNSADAATTLGRGSIRSPSLSISLGGSRSLSQCASPSDRHVGEGALDDSDTSSGSGGDGHCDGTAGADSSDEGATSRPRISPGPGSGGSVVPGFKTTAATPSPLSRVAGRQIWTDDEEVEERGQENHDDTSSPSPQSTSDTETDSQRSSPVGRSSVGRRSSRSTSHPGRLNKKTSGARIAKSRSRSSTLASLAAPSLRSRPPLIHQESCSSIRTVTAGEASVQDQYVDASNEVERFGGYRRDSRFGQNSVPMPDFVVNPSTKGLYANDSNRKDTSKLHRKVSLTERRIEYIRADDRRIRDAMLTTLKKALEDLAEEGDVQMCCMFSLVAPDELRISKARRIRFLDAYIDLLTRLQLHTCAAYLRKFCEIEDIRSKTLVETTIYTACGRCKRSLIMPGGPKKIANPNRGRSSYCSACQVPFITCSICRLPVKTLLFQCSVCHHGGHQACYRNYYMQHPMVDLPASSSVVRAATSNDDTGASSVQSAKAPTLSSLSGSCVGTDDDSVSTTSVPSTAAVEVPPSVESPRGVHIRTRLRGHLCAAGCGHFCWAASIDIDGLQMT